VGAGLAQNVVPRLYIVHLSLSRCPDATTWAAVLPAPCLCTAVASAGAAFSSPGPDQSHSSRIAERLVVKRPTAGRGLPVPGVLPGARLSMRRDLPAPVKLNFDQSRSPASQRRHQGACSRCPWSANSSWPRRSSGSFGCSPTAAAMAEWRTNASARLPGHIQRVRKTGGVYPSE